MTPAEAVRLCRYVKAACPNQAFDEYTPEVWAEIIPDWLTLDDARQAVISLKRKQTYVDISEIIKQASVTAYPFQEQERLRMLLDSDAYHAHLEEADARAQQLISQHHERLAIEGGAGLGQAPPDSRYIGPVSQGHWMHPRELARLQVAESRRQREAS